MTHVDQPTSPTTTAGTVSDLAQNTRHSTGDDTSQNVDVVVIGGGAAGLAAATSLARFRHRVLVIDSGAPRNAPADGVHNYLTRDGLPPAELVRLGRQELLGYGADVVAGTVTAVRSTGRPSAAPCFGVELADGRVVVARRVLVASGLVDELPEVPGLAGRWGRDVLHCPYCHGWEVRDQRLAVLVMAAPGLHTVQLWRQISDRVILVLAPGVRPSAQQEEQFAARGISVVQEAALELVVTDDRLRGLRLAGGSVVDCDALAISPALHARVDFLAPLGLHLVPFAMGETVIGSRLDTGAAGATDVAGVYAAGNATDLFAQVAGSVAGGLLAASAVNASLVEEHTAAAVAARGARRQGVPSPSPESTPPAPAAQRP